MRPIMLTVLALLAFGCASTALSQRLAPPWRRIFVDSGFDIAFDTSHVENDREDQYVIRLETRWKIPRRGRTKRTSTPFNRELIRAFLRCQPPGYKVISTVVSLNNGAPIDSVATSVADARMKEWSIPARGSADAGVADRVCAILRIRKN